MDLKELLAASVPSKELQGLYNTEQKLSDMEALNLLLTLWQLSKQRAAESMIDRSMYQFNSCRGNVSMQQLWMQGVACLDDEVAVIGRHS